MKSKTQRELRMKRLLLLSIILLTACGYPKNDSDKFFREDGTLREINTYEKGIISEVSLYFKSTYKTSWLIPSVSSASNISKTPLRAGSGKTN